MFEKLFGTKSKRSEPPPKYSGGGNSQGQGGSSVINAVQNAKDMEETLEKRKERIEKQIEHELSQAKAFQAQNKKSQALLCLKRKAMYTKQIENLNQQIMRNFEQRNLLEDQHLLVSQIKAQQEALRAGKLNEKELDPERVARMNDEMQEFYDQQREVQETLGQPMGMAADIDDEDLGKELEELGNENADMQALASVPAPSAKMPSKPLPAVPQQPQKTKEEEELAQLQAELA